LSARIDVGPDWIPHRGNSPVSVQPSVNRRVGDLVISDKHGIHMWWFIAGAILLAFLVCWAFTWGRVVRTLSSDAHFQEVAGKVPALKQAALENPVRAEQDAPQPVDQATGLLTSILTGWYNFGAGTQGPEDPRCMRTTAGLTVTYAVIPDGGKYDHHLWLRLPAAARGAAIMGRQMDEVLITLSCFVARLLGVEKWSFQPRGLPYVQQVVFTMNSEENEEFAKRPGQILSPEWLKVFRQQMMKAP